MSDIPGFDRAQAEYDAQEPCPNCGAPTSKAFCSMACRREYKDNWPGEDANGKAQDED